MSKLSAALYEDNTSYAVRRLLNTIVDSEVGPVFVTDYYEGEFRAQLLKSGLEVVIPPKDLYLEPVSLGYINNPAAVYTTRIPMREWYQGLTARNINCSNPFKKLPHKSLYNCITNNYPSLNKIKEEEATYPIAWNKRWAISPTNIFYRGESVGTSDFQFFEDYSYLEEELDIAIAEDSAKNAG